MTQGRARLVNGFEATLSLLFTAQIVSCMGLMPIKTKGHLLRIKHTRARQIGATGCAFCAAPGTQAKS